MIYGTEDGEVPCIQEGSVGAVARDDVACLTEFARHGAEDSDPFADVDEDKEEQEPNETDVDEDYTCC